MEGPLSLDLVAWLPEPVMPRKWRGKRLPAKRPDLDQYIKLVLDALQGVLYKDDSQVVDIYASKRYSWNGHPGWEVSIRECSFDLGDRVPDREGND